MRTVSWFKVGWMLSMCAGLIPCTVGMINFVFFMRSLADPGGPWQTPFGPLFFSLDEARAFRIDLGSTWTMVNQVAWANVVMTGVTVVVASWAGIRHRAPWGWLLVLFGMVWVGANDLTATLRVGRELGGLGALALPLAPMCLALPGLMLTAREVFSSPKASRD